MPRTKCGPLHDICRLTQSVVMGFGKLWQSLAVQPSVAMTRQFHNGMIVWVQNDGEYPEPFPVTNRVKQAKSKVQTDVLDELLYADDMAKNVSTERNMQEFQHEKDWGSVPASTWKANHYSEWTKTDSLQSLCLCWSFTTQSATRSCRAGQLIVALFLGRLRSSKRLTST